MSLEENLSSSRASGSPEASPAEPANPSPEAAAEPADTEIGQLLAGEVELAL